MALFDWLPRLSFKSDETANGDPRALTSKDIADLLGTGMVNRSMAGQTVTREAALTIGAFSRALDVICGMIGMMPLSLYKADAATGTRTKVKRADTEAKRFFDMLMRPNKHMTGYDVREKQMFEMALSGNSFFRIYRGADGQPVEMWELDPRSTSVIAGSPGERFYQHTDENGRQFVLTERDVLHIPGRYSNGRRGQSILDKAQYQLALAIAQEEFAAYSFENGLLMHTIFKNKDKMTTEEVEKLRSQLDENYTGTKNSGRPLLLDNEMQVETLTANFRDAEFNEQRHFLVLEIARFFGVPPHLLYDVTNSTTYGTGLSEQQRALLTTSLLPWITKIEQAYTQFLLPPEEWENGYSIRFDVDEILRPTMRERYEAYSIAVNAGWMEGNEPRGREDLPPLKELEKPFYPQSTAPPSVGGNDDDE